MDPYSLAHDYRSAFVNLPPCPHTPTSIREVEGITLMPPYSPDSECDPLCISSASLSSPSSEFFSIQRSELPSTPLQSLLTSSPSGFWKMADSSGMSPIVHEEWCKSCHSKSNRKRSYHYEDDFPKLASLEDHHNSQRSGDSERIYSSRGSPSSPSSLSSLSSTPTSPSLCGSHSEPVVVTPLLIRLGPSHSNLSARLKKNSSPTDPVSHGTVHSFSPCPARKSRHPVLPPYYSPGSSRGPRTKAAPLTRSNLTRGQISDASRKRSVPVSSETLESQTSRKRLRVNKDESANASDVLKIPNRTFPLRIPINQEFSLFYRRFAVSSVPYDGNDTSLIKCPPGATYNPPRDAFDLYTPRFTQGRGASKVGLCPCCIEGPSRGGEGKKVWLAMKFSAFKCYHMQYAHGISAMTGRPFSPPTAFKVVTRSNVGKHEKTEITQGKCHKCNKWVNVEGIKDVPAKVKELVWWKHAATCHQGSTIAGEGDVYVEDDVYRLASATFVE